MKFAWFLLVPFFSIASMGFADESPSTPSDEREPRIVSLLPGFKVTLDIEPAIPANFVAVPMSENPNMYDGVLWGSKNAPEAFLKNIKSLPEAIIYVKLSSNKVGMDSMVYAELKENIESIGGKIRKEDSTQWGSYPVHTIQAEFGKDILALAWVDLCNQDELQLSLVFELIYPDRGSGPSENDLVMWNSFIYETKQLPESPSMGEGKMNLHDAMVKRSTDKKNGEYRKSEGNQSSQQVKYNMNLAFPVDGNWLPLDPPILLSKNYTLWLVREGKDPSDNLEGIKIERYPTGSHITDVALGGIPEGAKIYDGLEDKNSQTLVYEVYSSDDKITYFCVVHFFQGDDAVYNVTYAFPSNLLSEKEKKKWIANLKAATTNVSSKKSAWIQISPEGVFQNGVELKPLAFKTYTHPSHRFRMDIPAAWLCIDDVCLDTKEVPGYPGSGSKRYLRDFRMDHEAFFDLSISDHEKFPDDIYIKNWADTLETVKGGGAEILEEGDIYNASGLHGKFVISKEPMGATCYQVIYVYKGRRFKIDCFAVHSESFLALRETFKRISTSFSAENPIID